MIANGPQIVKSVHRVVHPPTWRGETFALDFILLYREPTGAELLEVYKWAEQQDLANPRAIAPQTLEWSSLFNPRFFEAVRREPDFSTTPGIRLIKTDTLSLHRMDQRVLFWLQSVVFLAAVTMSAAVVQGRWSSGTLASKFDRLWQVGELAKSGLAPELATMALGERVRTLAADPAMPGVERLIAVRRLFETVIGALAADVSSRRVQVHQTHVTDDRATRFGFVDELRERIHGLLAIIVYGSSVASNIFADYDLVLVVDKPEATLRQFANTNPSWRGKELNVGIYSPDELWRMQLLSGDNLADYGICLFGDVELPEKPVDLLLARNISFGMVRQRQQLGMIGKALSNLSADGDDRLNLYHYFVKIPANIAKGTFGAVGRRLPTEDIHRWLLRRCGFDTVDQQAQAAAGNPAGALSNAAVATGGALRRLNEELGIVEPTSLEVSAGE